MAKVGRNDPCPCGSGRKAKVKAIDERLADAALVDLGSDSRQLLRAGLLEAVAVRVSAARTPAGILLAA